MGVDTDSKVGFWQAAKRTLLPFLAVKLLLLVALVMKSAVVPPQEVRSAIPMPSVAAVYNSWLAVSTAGDGRWYLRLAREGYDRVPYGTPGQHNWAYFPGYPAFLRLTGINIPLALVASSMFAFVGYVLLRMYLGRFLEPQVADTAVAFLIFFPFSNALGTLRPEAMIFMCWTASLLAWVEGRKNLAIWISVVAVVLKPEGLAILAYFFMDELLASRKEGVKPQRYLRLGIPLIPLALFSVYMFRLTGEPLAWAKIQEAWGSKFLVQPYEQTVDLFKNPLLVGRWGWDLTLVNVVCSVIGIGAIAAAAARPAYLPAAAFAAAVFLLSFLNFGYWQMGRHLAIAPTLAMGFALLPYRVRGTLVLFVAGVGAMTLLMFAYGLRFAYA